MSAAKLAPLLEAFFTERLQRQRRVSPNTVAAYRDTFRLLLRFVHEKLGRAPSDLLLADFDASVIGEFLDHLEKERGNSIRTRNVRLAAIRSFFRYAALEEPAHSLIIQRVLGIPQKRFEKKIVAFLTRAEVDALLAVPDRNTWLGRRDHALILYACQSGLRVSEITALRREDVELGTGAHVRCRGKGRKERCTPLAAQGINVLRAWFREVNHAPSDPVFPSQRGGHLSRDAVERLIKKHVAKAELACPSLAAKRVSPHVLRHTTAVDLLQSGVDRSVIALWLGHESVETTQIYLDADLAIKERALARTSPAEGKPSRYKPPDELLAFLQSI
ncbi:MAG: site-specific integrase [Deltaproteobacteria bacterium]|nr:site-specific integrase [Deltaproteobacteria bacterium]